MPLTSTQINWATKQQVILGKSWPSESKQKSARKKREKFHCRYVNNENDWANKMTSSSHQNLLLYNFFYFKYLAKHNHININDGYNLRSIWWSLICHTVRFINSIEMIRWICWCYLWRSTKKNDKMEMNN